MDNIAELKNGIVNRIDALDERIKQLVAELDELRNERYILKQTISAVNTAEKEVDDK